MGDQDDLKQLLKQAAELNAAISKMAGDQKTLLFGEYATEYLNEKMKNQTLRDSTKRSFDHHLRNHLIPGFGHLAFDKISNKIWLEWVARQTTITRFFNSRKCLTEVMLAAKEAGHISKSPRFDNPDEPRSCGRALEPIEIFKILRNTRDKFFRFIFFTFARMGCRPREILRWEWSMIRFNEPGKSWIDIPARISKTRRNRSIAINPDVSRRLYIDYHSGVCSKFVFPHRKNPDKPQLSYHGAFYAACRKARIECVPYDMRRTFVTRCAIEGKQLLYVARHLDTSVKLIESTYAKAHAQTLEDIVK